MKHKITVVDQNGKASTQEFSTGNKGILQAQMLHKPRTFVPKKGKGSFKRSKKGAFNDYDSVF